MKPYQQGVEAADRWVDKCRKKIIPKPLNPYYLPVPTPCNNSFAAALAWEMGFKNEAEQLIAKVNQR